MNPDGESTGISEKPRNRGFPDGAGDDSARGGDVDARALAALRERDGASFAELVEQGILQDDREAKRVRGRLIHRGLIERVGLTRVVRARHDCPSCRCDVGGRPRAIYRPVEDGGGA